VSVATRLRVCHGRKLTVCFTGNARAIKRLAIMTKIFSHYKHLILSATVVLSFSVGQTVVSQHEGHTMPGMSKPKPKPKAKRKPASRRKRPIVRRKQPAKKHDMANMPGMQPPVTFGTPPASTEKTDPHIHTPGMQMPTTAPAPSASPEKADPHKHMPGMQMPATSGAPSASPEKTDPHTHMPAPGVSPSPGTSDHKMDNMPGMKTGSMNMGPLLVMSGNDMGIRVGASDTNIVSMGAMGSGTSWQPATTPQYMIHKQSGDWLLMFHYNAVVGVNSQGGPRGVTKFESANWFMPMAFRKVGPGTLQLRSMFSFEPFTFPPGGSPLLFQTGETYKGQPIIDRQHPHDLFMELSVSYTLPLGERGTWFTYFGYPGEPALGPTAFMHRASASENSSAVLSHHLQDSSHITFGVFTTGFTYRWFKLEGSIFNGREPDENRYNFDAHRWNSRSARLSFAPNQNWSMQISHGFLRDPEAQEPGDVRRTTASLSYNRPFDRGNWATSIVWGRNHENHSGEIFNLNGYVAESTVNFLDKNYLYTRLELTDKNALLRDADRALLGITDHHPSFRIGAYTFGGARDVWTTDKLSMAIGSDLTFYSKPSTLDPIYGNTPISWKVHIRFRPGKMAMSGLHGSH
jgi:hypothetical protein